jgi:KUP system potassium uptake protein
MRGMDCIRQVAPISRLAFFMANSTKIAEGGYVPLAFAACVYGIMWIWHSGREAVTRAITEKLVPIDTFMADLTARGVPRVPGTAVFLTQSSAGVPPVMTWHVKHNRSLHERIMVLNVSVEPVPWVRAEDRARTVLEVPNFWRATTYFGFMERPDIPPVLKEAKEMGCDLLLDDVTYYVGRETVVSREDGKGLPKWRESLFAVMERNAVQLTGYFKLPEDQVVEIGRKVAV